MRSASGEFLRPAHPRRRRRQRSLRVLRRLRVLLPLAPVAALAVWLLDGPTFRLQRIECRSTERISDAWIRSVLDEELGRNLFLLSLVEVRESLSAHPWLASVEVRKELPDSLHVLVEERRPAAILETAGEEDWFVGLDGRRIAPVASNDPREGLLPLAAGDIGGEVSPALGLGETGCLRRALAVAQALATPEAPAWGRELLRIEIVGDDDFRLLAAGIPFTVLVRSREVADRARLLVRLLPHVRDRVDAVGEVDLRFAGRVVVRPPTVEDRRTRPEAPPQPKET